MALNNYKWDDLEKLNFGQGSVLFESGTTVITGKEIYAITFVTATAFTTLTPGGTTNWPGTTNQNGGTVAGTTFPAGLTIYGYWTGFTLASGSVLAYMDA